MYHVTLNTSGEEGGGRETTYRHTFGSPNFSHSRGNLLHSRTTNAAAKIKPRNIRYMMEYEY
jgi:hypothetical protein